MVYLSIINKLLRYCHAWMARQYSYPARTLPIINIIINYFVFTKISGNAVYTLLHVIFQDFFDAVKPV